MARTCTICNERVIAAERGKSYKVFGVETCGGKECLRKAVENGGYELPDVKVHEKGASHLEYSIKEGEE